jgi:hypothetical protein
MQTLQTTTPKTQQTPSDGSTQAALMALQPHRTIHVVRAGHQVQPSAKEPHRDPALVLSDEAPFDTAKPSWPYGAGSRCEAVLCDLSASVRDAG